MASRDFIIFITFYFTKHYLTIVTNTEVNNTLNYNNQWIC